MAVGQAVPVALGTYTLDQIEQLLVELENQWPGVVYYVRIGDHIKIGYSAYFYNRMVTLQPAEILAVEPGHYRLERQRHREFVADRAYRRDYFHASPALLEHVARVAREHGTVPVTASAAADAVVAALSTETLVELIKREEVRNKTRAEDREDAVLGLYDLEVSLSALGRETGHAISTLHRMKARALKRRLASGDVP